MAAGSTSISSRKRGKKISSFRPIYYLGCKNSFVSEIKNAVDRVDPSNGRVCDLFSGSGVVGAALSEFRPVTTVDIQEYSRVLCSALLPRLTFNTDDANDFLQSVLHSTALSTTLKSIAELIDYEKRNVSSALNGDADDLVSLLESPPLEIVNLSSEDFPGLLGEIACRAISRLKDNGLWNSPDSTVLRHFGGVYFSFHQAAVLDAILSEAERLPASRKDTFKAAALSTASSLVNTVGKQFAQPIRPRNKDGTIKTSIAKLVNRDRSLETLNVFSTWLAKYFSLPVSKFETSSLQGDYASTLSQHASNFSVIYADPPYTRDHYSRFYHVLETMSLRDNPSFSQVVKSGKLEWSRGFYRSERHQSPFCIRSTAINAFEKLFSLAEQHHLPMVLSYSPHETGDGTHPRVVSTSQILEMAHSYYSKVEVCQVSGVVHNQLNRSDLKLKTREHAEILIMCSY